MINASVVGRRGTGLVTVHVVGMVARHRRDLHPETSAFRVVKYVTGLAIVRRVGTDEGLLLDAMEVEIREATRAAGNESWI